MTTIFGNGPSLSRKTRTSAVDVQKKLNWRKLQFIENRGELSWSASHYQLPFGFQVDSSTFRVFAAVRSEEQRSSIACMDLELRDDRFEIKNQYDEPVLTPGPTGFFDQHGVFPSSIIEHNGQYYLYYIGWTQGVEAPLFYASIGLAISHDGLHFERYSQAPIMERSEYDPCLVTSPNVYQDTNGWRMNYVSGIKWERDPETQKLKSFYHLKSAHADDPVNWVREGHISIDFKEGETNIARPSVLKFSDTDYRMWYSYVHSQSGKYLMGYAHSNDGLAWTRDDENIGIGLDNEYCQSMICYPFVFKMGDRLFMLYNGDNYGQKGFGIAVAEHR